MPLVKLKRNLEDFNRFREIITTLSEEGLHLFVKEYGLTKYVPFRKKIFPKITSERDEIIAKNLVKTFEKLGPTFIKLGQILSLRPDVIPDVYMKEFEKMVDEVKPQNFEILKKNIDINLKEKNIKIKKRIASASVSQVYLAEYENKNIVLKIKKTGVDKQIEQDIRIIKVIISIVEKKIKNIKLREVIEEFEEYTKRELDFRIEKANIERFRNMFKEDERVYAPEVFLGTEKVLAMEFVEGKNIQDVKSKKVIETGADLIFEQVFIQGFFHADPHPGNILFGKNRIIFIDFGIVGRFNKILKNKSIKLLHALMLNDPELITIAIIDLNVNKNAIIDSEKLEKRLGNEIIPIQGNTIKELKVTSILKRIFLIIREEQIQLPLDFILFGKTIFTLEGIALKYYQDFKIEKSIAKVIKKINLSPLEYAEELGSEIKDYFEIINKIPKSTLNILENYNKSGLRINIDSQEVKRFNQELDKSSATLSLGLMSAALFITSAIFANTTTIPTYNNINIFAIMTFALGMITGFWAIERTR